MPWDRERWVDALNEASELRFVELAAAGDALDVALLAGDQILATVRLAPTGAELVAISNVDASGQPGCDEHQATALLVSLRAAAYRAGLERLRVDTTDAIVRDRARAAGMTGGLREPLVGPVRTTDVALPSADGGLAESLTWLLPGVEVRARATPGAFRRALRTAAAQTSGMVHLDVALDARERPLRLAAPDRPDLLVESVALAVETTVAIRRLFGPAASHIRELAFDRAESGFVSGQVAGTAHTNLGHIHLNVSFALPDGVVAMRRQRAERIAMSTPEQNRIVAAMAMPYSLLEGVTAHECWHQIENAFELRRFADSMELKRQLGGYFGVDTLEQVIVGRDHGAPPERKRAYERLIGEVSLYATTNIRECTAEIMKLWWCAMPPAPPLAVLWGQLMEQFFGVRR